MSSLSFLYRMNVLISVDSSTACTLTLSLLGVKEERITFGELQSSAQ